MSKIVEELTVEWAQAQKAPPEVAVCLLSNVVARALKEIEQLQTLVGAAGLGPSFAEIKQNLSIASKPGED